MSRNTTPRRRSRPDSDPGRAGREARRNAASAARALRSLLAASLVVGSSSLPVAAAGQSIQVQVERGPHYVGEPLELNVVAEGFAEDPQPQIAAPDPSHGTLQYLGVTPSVQSAISIVNGQVQRSRRVTFVYAFRYASSQAGLVPIGPFTVAQGSQTARSARVELELNEVPSTDELRLHLDVPSERVFLGQRVPVELEFWIARELQEPLQSYTLTVPLFEDPSLRFVDDPSPRTDTDLRIETAGGTLQLRGTAREERVGDEPFLVVTVRRTMIAREAGRIEAEPPTVVVSRATRWRRDLFGTRQAVAVRKLKGVGEAVSFEVGEVPAEGRPPSFAGAIGRGFTLEVSADRSVVQVGEPIVLSFELRGDGDLSVAGLPPLDAPGLLDPERFRVPAEPPAGQVDDDGKHFSAMVRVLDEDVREVPELEYSWFDAETQRFESTHSRPIALSVGAAEVIGAADVQSASAGAVRDLASASGEAAPLSEGGDAARPRSFALTGADLAIERDPDRLLRNDRAARGGWAPSIGLHGLGVVLVAVAWLDRRRREIDPSVASRNAALSEARRELERALGLPEREAADALARALRAMLALAPEGGGRELDALLGECDARSFAPASGSAAHVAGAASAVRDEAAKLPESMRERARALADALEQAAR